MKAPFAARTSAFERDDEIREASAGDLAAIREIYNEGIEDRIATVDAQPKSREDVLGWWNEHTDRYGILIASE